MGLSSYEVIDALNVIRLQSEEKSSLKRKTIDVPLALCQDNIVVQFCSNFGSWQPRYDEYQLRGAKQQWYEWFSKYNLRVTEITDSNDVTAVQPFINTITSDFANFLSRLQKDLHNSSAIKDPSVYNQQMKDTIEKDPKTALKASQKVLALDPHHTPVYINLTTVYLKLKMKKNNVQLYNQAIAAAEHNLSINPTDTRQHEWLALCYKMLKKTDKQYDALVNRGNIMEDGKRYRLSLDVFNEGV